MYDGTYHVVNRASPDLSRLQFRAQLYSNSSPSLPLADAAYDRCNMRRVSPRTLLAMFAHESTYGKYGVCHDYNTHSPGNTRTSRNGTGHSITTPTNGTFIKYDTWPDGWDDMAYRLIDPAFDYVQAHAETLARIIPIWAPSSDKNDPLDYIANVVRTMERYDMGPDRYQTIDGMPVIWTPAPLGNYNGAILGHKWIIIHDIEGSAQSGIDTLSDPTRGASVQFINDATNNRVIQMVGCFSQAWGCGNDDGNGNGLQIENPGYAGQPYDANVVRNAGRITGVLSRDFGIPLQRITTAQFQAGIPGVLGHGDIVPQHGPQNQWHHDPGPTWPWDTMMSIAQQIAGGAATPGPFFPETGFGVLGGILADYNARGAVANIGYPRSWEYDTLENGVTIRRQWFERGCAEWIPNRPDQPDITWSLLGSAILDDSELLAKWKQDRATRAAFKRGNSWNDIQDVKA